ncbi:MAG: hypothetical protein Q7S27_07075 [Nanoarchaeota archaeon]|nr:hypothetical protein [Nanoarchaeota archaeon]
MLTKIKIKDLVVYTNQLIDPIEFQKLYRKEEILIVFNTGVNNVNKKAYATFLAQERHKYNFQEGDSVIFRIQKNYKKFEFISVLGQYGKFHIFKEIIETLQINNNEKLDFEVIKTINRLEEKRSGSINLSNIDDSSVIFRENNFITIIKKRTIPITLPQFIKITPELIELFYLIHGDGHYKTKLYFVNKDAGLHQFVIKNFKQILRIPKDIWRARLLFNHNSDPLIAKEYWKDKIELKEEQFYPTISKAILNTSEIGNLRIVIDKMIVGSIFRYIFSQLQNLKGREALNALNGLLCAEGSIDRSSHKALHRITINFSQQEKEMFKKILVESQINKLVKEKKDRFIIDGWTNLYEFFKLFFSNNVTPFYIHKQRYNDALNGFLEHSFTKTMEKYLTLLNNKESIDTNGLIKETGYLGNSIRNLLRKKQYKSFVKIEGIGVKRKPLMYSLTKEGREFLILIKRIKEELNVKNVEKEISELLKFSIINIDKPSGPTSFSISDYIRKQLGLSKTSHFGTLE